MTEKAERTRILMGAWVAHLNSLDTDLPKDLKIDDFDWTTKYEEPDNVISSTIVIDVADDSYWTTIIGIFENFGQGSDLAAASYKGADDDEFTNFPTLS